RPPAGYTGGGGAARAGGQGRRQVRSDRLGFPAPEAGGPRRPRHRSHLDALERGTRIIVLDEDDDPRLRTLAFLSSRPGPWSVRPRPVPGREGRRDRRATHQAGGATPAGRPPPGIRRLTDDPGEPGETPEIVREH